VRVLILGGTGLTGPYAVRRLHALGHDVTIFDRGEHEAEAPAGVRRVRGQFGDFPRELINPAPDVVVHMWAMTAADAVAFLSVFSGVAGRGVRDSGTTPAD
jgi:nucleoside-diphosphate-sugar epimerase